MSTPTRPGDLELLRFQARLTDTLRQVASPDKAFRFSLRAVKEFFDADRACIAFLPPGSSEAEITHTMGGDDRWDREMLTSFLRLDRPEVPFDTIVAPIRKSRPGAALLAVQRDEPFERGDGAVLARVARVISACLREIDRERAREIRARIDRKIMEELRPKDLFYQILHGIRSLTHYDHSSALLIKAAGGEVLELVAEQIAWRKGKSDRIGLRLPLDGDQRSLLRAGRIYGFDRQAEGWRQWRGPEATTLAGLCDYNRTAGDPRAEQSMLCAALVGRDGFLGVLKVASQHPGAFGTHEVELIRSFLPQAAVALQNSRRNETLRERILEVEKRNAVAALARGVSHDVNNALGSVLPLVQQMRADLAEGRVDPDALARDLDRIERSLGLTRRIFAGMLTFARGASRQIQQRDVSRAIDGTISVLGDSLQRRGIRLDIDRDDELPTVRCRQGDLEQLLLNLTTNARDAMPSGGTLTLSARRHGDRIEIRIRDTGDGIPEDEMARVYEPFFSTKRGGTGLGLSICNSIVSDMKGTMRIDTRIGEGTEVVVGLPLDGPGGGTAR